MNLLTCFFIAVVVAVELGSVLVFPASRMRFVRAVLCVTDS
jgi:hypothetical protein